jgi:hypothetical protein
MNYLLDLLAAHRKALLAALTALLIQWVDADTADWIVAGVGIALTALVPNDEQATRRIYRKRR